MTVTSGERHGYLSIRLSRYRAQKIRTLLPRFFLSIVLDWLYVLVLALPTSSSLGLTFALCTALLKHRLVALRGEVPARPSRLDLFPRATCDSVAAK